jgi:hypothetical protein
MRDRIEALGGCRFNPLGTLLSAMGDVPARAMTLPAPAAVALVLHQRRTGDVSCGAKH